MSGGGKLDARQVTGKRGSDILVEVIRLVGRDQLEPERNDVRYVSGLIDKHGISAFR